MTISQRIFEELRKQKKKQKDLATYIGISTSAVSDWKKKGTNPSAENISAIADFLEVSTDYLLTGKESESPDEISLMNANEKTMMNLFRMLTEKEQDRIIGRLENMVEESQKFKNKEAI